MQKLALPVVELIFYYISTVRNFGVRFWQNFQMVEAHGTVAINVKSGLSIKGILNGTVAINVKSGLSRLRENMITHSTNLNPF